MKSINKMKNLNIGSGLQNQEASGVSSGHFPSSNIEISERSLP